YPPHMTVMPVSRLALAPGATFALSSFGARMELHLPSASHQKPRKLKALKSTWLSRATMLVLRNDSPLSGDARLRKQWVAWLALVLLKIRPRLMEENRVIMRLSLKRLFCTRVVMPTVSRLVNRMSTR